VSVLARVEDAAQRRLTPETRRALRRTQGALLRTADSLGWTKLGRARAAATAGAHDTAHRLVTSRLSERPDDRAALSLASQVAMRRGAVVEAAGFAMTLARLSRDPADWSYARLLTGRIRETDAHWEPVVSAPPPAAPAGGGVAYLASESRPFVHNGYTNRVHGSLTWLARAGRDVVGVTMPGFPGLVGVGEPPTDSVIEDVSYRHLLPRAGKQLKALAFDEYLDLSAQLLAGFVAQTRPALLHVGPGCRGYDTALVANAVARWRGIPWIYEVHDVAQGADGPRRLATHTRMMQACGLVITLSGAMRDEISSRHGIPLEKIRAVPIAVETERLAPRDRDPALAAKLRLAESFTLGSVSDPRRPIEGQELLIRAVAQLRRRGRPVSALLLGDGVRGPKLERLARRLGVGGYVVFAGQVPFEEVPAYYAQMDLFVVPRVDGLDAPVEPFEAMAMKIPVLVPDAPPLAEIAGSGERARTFQDDDPAALAQEVAALMDAPVELARLVDAAVGYVAQVRSWPATAAAIGDAYDELLAGPGKR
jgi:phosphatidylinositol alpha-1,6-mannosyltransferase